MGVADELAALRKSSNVKAKSTRLGDAVNKHGFASPEQLAEERKLKLEKEKQSRLDAQAVLHKVRQSLMGNIEMGCNCSSTSPSELKNIGD